MSLRTRRALPVLVLPLFVACGTTVPLGGVSAASGDGLSAPAGQAAGPGTPGSLTGGLAGSANDGSGPGGSVGGQGSSGQASTVGSSPRQADPTTSPDKRRPVRVGVLYLSGADQAAGALGISGLATGDAMAQARAVANYLNARGGLAGHPIDLRDGGMSASSALSDQEGTYAQACASLVEDQKVSYVVSYVNLTSSRLACYAKHGVTVLDDQSAVIDSAGTHYASSFAGPGELAPGRATQVLIDALWRRGWLNPSSKVGTLVPDNPDGVEVETRYLIPALARHGLKPAATERAGKGTSTANQSGTVVKFRSAGVDRVIPMLQSPLFLMEAAESQGYHPAYAMNSGFGPGALLEGTVPKAQLKNAAGIGWSKFLDIGSGTRPGPASANETLCFALMAKAGQQSTDATTQAFQASLCDVLMFLKSTADRFGLGADLLDQVRSQGLAFGPADTYAIRMQPRRADGVAAYRDLTFDDSCSCFQYTSGNRAAP